MHSENVSEPLVEIRDLVKQFPKLEKRSFTSFLGRNKAMVTILDGVSLTIYKGEALGLIGESGCGKTTLGRSILRLVEPTSGEVHFGGQDVLKLKDEDLRQLRKRMQMIFQNPFAALNPNMRVRDILEEAVQVKWALGTSNNGNLKANLVCTEIETRIGKLIRDVNLQQAKLSQYPWELSGGERRRVGIARILAVDPDFIVADEPLASLDVSIRSQILNLLLNLRKEQKLTFLYISHDIGAVRQICDRVAVMYLGNIVELAEKKEIRADRCFHPYTKKLMLASDYLSIEQKRGSSSLRKNDDFVVDDEEVEYLDEDDSGCNFRFRCCRFQKLDKPSICSKEKPLLQLISNQHSENHMAACHFAHEVD
jgi:ABC-type oligopeptide transport system ATPase subunit